MRKLFKFRRRKRRGFGSAFAALIVLICVWYATASGMVDLPELNKLGERIETALGEAKAYLPDVKQPTPTPAPITDESTDELKVYFLDVGQGDCELIQLPNNGENFNILIDTGEYEYADGLVEMLKSLGVARIDRLICTHPHSDHMGCMATVVRSFEIGEMYMPRVADDVVPTTASYEALLDSLYEKGITAKQLCTGAEISCPSGAELAVLAPEPDADWDDLNNYSGVIKLTYGQTSFMFTGDAETASEKLVVQAALQNGQDISATVLKCGHHGSKTSSSAKFLRAVRPSYAVISCGEDNSYGHPHEATLEKLDMLGTTVYRTDESGTILAKSNGEAVTFETGLPSVKG